MAAPQHHGLADQLARPATPADQQHPRQRTSIAGQLESRTAPGLSRLRSAALTRLPRNGLLLGFGKRRNRMRICASFLFALLAFAAPARAQDTPAPVARLDHVAIWSADMQKSIDFYPAVFGLTSSPRPSRPAARAGWVGERARAAHPARAQRTGQPAAPRPFRGRRSPDLDPVIAWLRRMASRLGRHRRPPGRDHATRTDGVQQIFFQDPDGYWIEVNDVKHSSSPPEGEAIQSRPPPRSARSRRRSGGACRPRPRCARCRRP